MSSLSKNIQSTIEVLLQSTEGHAKTILANITDIDYLSKLFDIVPNKEIKDLIQVRITQIKTEEQLKRYDDRRIELEEGLKLINTNVRPSLDEQGFIIDAQEIKEGIQLSLNEAKELHRIAKELLQKSVKSGDLHIKQGEIEVAVRRVLNKQGYVRRDMLGLIEYLFNIEKQRRERLSHTEVGRRLSLIKSKRGQQQPQLLKRRN